jgi:hypothetical protein
VASERKPGGPSRSEILGIPTQFSAISPKLKVTTFYVSFSTLAGHYIGASPNYYLGDGNSRLYPFRTLILDVPPGALRGMLIRINRTDNRGNLHRGGKPVNRLTLCTIQNHYLGTIKHLTVQRILSRNLLDPRCSFTRTLIVYLESVSPK